MPNKTVAAVEGEYVIMVAEDNRRMAQPYFAQPPPPPESTKAMMSSLKTCPPSMIAKLVP